MSPKDQTDRITATPSAPVCSAVTPSGPFADLFPAELRWGQILALLAIIAVAMAYRLSFFASETMPILDGGMFHEFIAAVAENDLWLPPTATYNHNEVPFALYVFFALVSQEIGYAPERDCSPARGWRFGSPLPLAFCAVG